MAFGTVFYAIANSNIDKPQKNSKHRFGTFIKEFLGSAKPAFTKLQP